MSTVTLLYFFLHYRFKLIRFSSALYYCYSTALLKICKDADFQKHIFINMLGTFLELVVMFS